MIYSIIQNNRGGLMKKITIIIQDNALLFKYRTNKPVATNLLNTNIISDNELVFSEEYMMQNAEIVSLFLKDLCVEMGTAKIEVSHHDMVSLVLRVTCKLEKIDCFTIREDYSIPYSIVEEIIKCGHVGCLNCYSIPTFMIELLDRHNIKVETRSEVLFTSRFMLENELTSFDLMYYKKCVRLCDFSPMEMEDFRTFIHINKYLKVLHMDKYTYANLLEIIPILKELRKKVVVQIHADIDDPDEVAELKNLNKELKPFKIKLSLRYSDTYLEKNYINQISFTILKICALFIFVLISSIFGYLFYNYHHSLKEVEDTIGELKYLMEKDPDPTLPQLIDPEGEDNLEPFTPIINNYDKLLSVNGDTVGWLTVNETNIDYPVVKTTDNQYYLNRNFYKEKDSNGWVFMDYRNSIDSLDTNTIIYAHNRYYSGVMFGTLNNVTKKKWYTNDANLYITFHSLYREMKWKVFSIYSIDVTSDYLYTNFETLDDYQEFLTMIKDRSDYPIPTEVNTNNKILTLSTCLDNNKRLVVHAVLQE